MKTVEVKKPLVDDNLEEISKNSKEFIKLVTDEDNPEEYYTITMHVTRELAATAVMFAMKPRYHTSFNVTVGKFDGSEYVYSVLKSSHMDNVTYEG